MMKDLTEKVETLEKRLDELGDVFDVIRKSLTSEHGKQRHSVRIKAPSGRPNWVEEIFKCFNEISAELRSVKKTLGTFTDSGHSQSDGSATSAGAAPEAGLQHDAPAQGQYDTVRVSPAIPESGQRESAATDGSEPFERLSATASPEQNVTAQEPRPQLSQETVRCAVSLTPSPSTEPPNLTTQDGALLNPQLEDGIAPTFCCKYRDISRKLNEAKFEKFSSDPRVKEKGYFKLVIEDLPPLTVEQASFSQPGEDHFTNFSCRRDSRGLVQVTRGQSREIMFPSFPLPESQRRSWSREQLKEFWECTLKDPPQGMHYVIGDPLFPDIELSPGEGLERIGGLDLGGVGTVYAYLAFGESLSIMHGEDFKFRSMNVLRSGEDKDWLVVKPAYGKELERRMRQEFRKMGSCSQALRHLSRVITPSKLDEWGIPYSLDYCKPGEAIVTEPGAYHQVKNRGANYAIAINILYGSSPAIPKDYQFCRKSCGPHAITAAHIRMPEEGPLNKVQGNRRAHPERRTQLQVAGKKRTAVPIASQPKKRKITHEMGNLCKTVCGKEAFHRLCSLIGSWRDRSKPLFETDEGTTAVRLVHVIVGLEGRSQLTEFLVRLAKVKLAEIVEKGKDGRTRAEPAAIMNLIKDLKWQEKDRKKLAHYLSEGRQWRRIIGSFDGLLALIPPNREDRENLQISGLAYLKLSDDDIKMFHSFLESNEFIQSMCRIGYTFQASIWNNTEVPEFKWESEDRKRIARLPIKGLAPFIKEFEVISANEWELGQYDWPKPDLWDWEWPQNPASVSPSDTPCDQCDEKECNCIITCLPKDKPRITNEGGKGQGVRVVGMCVKGQILGEFYGEFVPLNTYHDGWPIEFTRPDLNDEPVAQLYPGNKGNWVRKVNHSCDPSAEFRVLKRSGCWRKMLVAIRNLPDNGEITVNCGKKFLSSQGKECLCDVCR